MEKNVNEIREFISAKENLANAFGTLMAVVIAIICVAFIPFKIMNSESHTVYCRNRKFSFHRSHLHINWDCWIFGVLLELYI
jgi:hypothetical protein